MIDHHDVTPTENAIRPPSDVSVNSTVRPPPDLYGTGTVRRTTVHNTDNPIYNMVARLRDNKPKTSFKYPMPPPNIFQDEHSAETAKASSASMNSGATIQTVVASTYGKSCVDAPTNLTTTMRTQNHFSSAKGLKQETKMTTPPPTTTKPTSKPSKVLHFEEVDYSEMPVTHMKDIRKCDIVSFTF
jgi:hypothetical protein